MKLRIVSPVAALFFTLACRGDEPGTSVYVRTDSLTVARADSLQDAVQAADFRVAQSVWRGTPSGPWRGRVRLVRGADSPAELERVAAWLRQQRGVLAAGPDSATVFQ